MLVIRTEQMKVFEQLSADRFAGEMIEHCREFSPRLCKTLSDEQLTVAIDRGFRAAAKYGFTQRGPVRLYIDMTIVLGSGFDTDPQYPWAGEVLRSAAPQMERADALHFATQNYLSIVDGPNNVFTLAALADLAEFCRGGPVVEATTLRADLRRFMGEMHPRKVGETPAAGLDRLIDDALAKGRRYGFRKPRSLAVMAVLMFAFGHRFDADPFLPWIARTLDQADGAGSDDIAEKMERRALVWLDAVLRNAEANR